MPFLLNRRATSSFLVLVGFIICTCEAIEDPISSNCPQINKYLQSAYECRQNEFQRHLACQENRIELRCPRSKHIAIHSASFGWSDRLRTSDCPSSRTFESGCPRTCAIQQAQQQCQGKRRCFLEADQVETEPKRCSPGSIKYLGVIYTCVKKSTLRHLESTDSIYVDPCDGDDPEDEEPGRPNPPFIVSPVTDDPAIRSAWLPTESASTAPANNGYALRNVKTDAASVRNDEPPLDSRLTTTFGWNRKLPATQGRSLREGLIAGGPNGVDRRPPPPRGGQAGAEAAAATASSSGGGGGGIQIQQTVTRNSEAPLPTTIWIHSFMDWIWTWKYIRDNTEKFVLYMLLGLSLGTIAILVVILLHMMVNARRHHTKQTRQITDKTAQQGTGASCSSPTWRMPESESSTGDDRTLHDDDVELTSFNHIDSLQRHANYHQHQTTTTAAVAGRPPSYTTGMPSPTTTTTATITRSYSQANPVVTRCYTPSPPPAMPDVAPNGGYLPQATQMGNGRVEVTPLPPAHCVGSLGRTYSNHYRRDSYQLDPAPGCRTLQPMQHYYG